MTRLGLSLALMLGMLAGCVSQGGNDAATADGTVLGETAHDSEGGIGGTGAPLRKKQIAGGDEAEGGIGGTGIFGTVTAFGSIVVNGLTVDVGEGVIETQASIVGRNLPLTVGSTVLVEANPAGDGWIAERASLYLPIVGPVSAIDASSGKLTVMGTEILLDDNVTITDRRGTKDGRIIRLTSIAPADRLAVSGLWRGGAVVATRIDRLDDDGPDSLRGLLLTAPEGAVVGGTRLSPDCCDDLESPAYVDLLGDYREGRLVIDRLDVGHALLFSDRVDQLVVEAFLARDPDGEGFHLSGFGIPADQTGDVAAEPGVRSLFVGAYDDAFRIRQSVPLPADRSAWTDALRSLGDVNSSD